MQIYSREDAGHQVSAVRHRRVGREGGEKGTRPRLYGCNTYPACDFTTPHLPIPESCPKCGASFIVEKRGKLGAVRTCIKEGCDWEAALPETPAAAVPEIVGTAQS